MKAAEFIFDHEERFCQRGSTAHQLVQRYHRDDTQVESGLAAGLHPLLADWLRIAHAVYLSDRFMLRPRQRWTGRRFRLVISVRAPDVWPHLQDAVSDVLRHLTDNTWEFEWTPWAGPAQGPQEFLPFARQGGPLEVALSSGGLDSLAGALNRVRDAPGHRFLLVSAVTNSKLMARLRRQMAFLQQMSGGRIEHVALEHGFRGLDQKTEYSQRARGFLHLTLGAVVALMAGNTCLNIYENGVGAVNLPLDSGQIGAQCSRPVHPITLEKMSALASRIARFSRLAPTFHFHNPFLSWTKGRMCRVLAEPGVPEIARHTISCDNPPRVKGKDHCGICTSCILRRLSLSGADVADPPGPYVTDLCSGGALDDQSLGKFERMGRQAGVLRTLLSGGEGWTGWRRRYSALEGTAVTMVAAGVPAARTVLQELFRQYVLEWDLFARRCPRLT